MADLLMFAASAAHGAAEAHAEPTALGLNATVFVSLAMLLFLGILAWKKVPALIGKMLDDKIAGIRSQLDEASTLRNEAEALRNEYAAKLAALDGEVGVIRARAEEEAASLVAKTEADAKDLVARRQRMAEDRIAAAERAAIADVRETASRAAVAAAAGLISDRLDAPGDKPLIDRAIAELGRA